MAAALPVSLGCAADDSAPAPAPVGPRRVEKTIHFACRGRESILAAATHLELQIGDQRIRSQLHSAETRRQALESTDASDQAQLMTATHFFTDVPLSVEAAQSYSVYAMIENGLEVFVAGGIHVPGAADRLRAASANPSELDPNDLLDDEDCAVWAAFNTPSLISHDADTAQRVIDEIRRAPSFGALTTAIGLFPNPDDPRDAPPTPDRRQTRAGWVVGVYRYYQIGAQPPVPVYRLRLDGTQVLDASGRPQIVIDWNLSSETYLTVQPVSVSTLAAAVVREVNASFQNQRAAYEGVKYFTYPGLATQAAGSASGSVSGSRSGLGAEDDSFDFSQQGVTTAHRKLEVEPNGSSFGVKLTNYLALGAMFGVSHFDANGAELSTQSLGYVSSTYYPSLVRLAGASSGEASFIRPSNAVRTTVWTNTMGVRDGTDPGWDGDGVSYTRRAIFTWIATVMTDIIIPGLCLTMGVVGGKKAGEDLLHAMIEGGSGQLIDAAIEVVLSAAASVYNVTEGQNVGAVLLDFGKDFLRIVARLAELVLLESPAYAVATAKILFEALTTTTLEVSTPLLGWALVAMEIVKTVAQLAFTTEHIVAGQVLTHGVIRYSHPLAVRITPKDSAYFPSGVAYCRVQVSSSDGKSPFMPTDQVVAFAPDSKGGFESFETVVSKVPILVPLTVKVSLYDRDPNGTDGATARGTVLGEHLGNVSSPGEEQTVEFEIDIPPLPIIDSTQLIHDVALVATPTGFAWSASGTPAPVPDLNPYRCQAGALCGVSSIHVRQNAAQAGRVTFDFTTFTADGASPVMAGVAMAPSLSKASSVASVSISPPPRGVAVRRLVTSLAGRSIVLSQTKTEAVRVYLAGDDDSDFPAETWQENDASLYTTSRSSDVQGARLSPDGTCLFLALGEAVEIIPIPLAAKPRANAQTSYLVTRPGSATGCISLAVAAAGFHLQRQFAALDSGLARVSVFDYAGNFIPYFGSPNGYVELNRGSRQNRLFHDIDVDSAGQVWVLVSEPDFSRYYLEVYGRTGALLAAFTDVAADRFALDRFDQVFTLNRRASTGPKGYAVPSISRWYLQNS